MNYIFSFYIALNGLLGFVAADGLIMFVIMPVYMMATCLIDLIDKLERENSMTNDDNDVIENNQTTRYEKLKVVVEVHQITNQSIILVEDLLVIPNLICISTIVITCVTSLYAFIRAGWYLGITFVLVNIFQLFIYSVGCPSSSF